MKYETKESIVNNKLISDAPIKMKFTEAKFQENFRDSDDDSEPLSPISIEKAIDEAKIKIGHSSAPNYYATNLVNKFTKTHYGKSTFKNKRGSAQINILKNKNPSVYPNKPILKIQAKNGLKGKPKLTNIKSNANLQANNDAKPKGRLVMVRKSGNTICVL